ncbi:MAG: DUF4143 domain-containing protein [Oligoflexia bacterium]|nr:DUF4143 domain-containing protein [Oligoflexia bacterium]
MYTRLAAPPPKSFFLFGPRGTGKSTWLKGQFPTALWFDLLLPTLQLRLTRDRSLFRQSVEALTHKSWIVVDEVQKLPWLLDEIHSLLFEHGNKFKFALSGSSSRKLKHTGVNLLAGRAINRNFFPLTAKEMNYDFEVEDLLQYGCLPAIRLEKTQSDKIDFLEAYVANYVREEIQQEALVKNLDSFSRFLDVASICNGQVTNTAGISRDAAVARPTVQGYFDILVDTLIGFWLPAWTPKAKIKEVRHPKFYFFDPGVVRGLQGLLRDKPHDQERGYLLETLVLHELRAHMSYANIGGKLTFWRTPLGSEVDFIWSRGTHGVGIEIKASKRWKSEMGKPLKNLVEARFIKKAIVVYLGSEVLKDGPLTIYPYKKFTENLDKGHLLD